VLTHDVEWFTAGNEECELGTARKQVGKLIRNGQNLFEIVDHQQKLTPGEECQQSILWRLATQRDQANSLRNRRKYQIGFTNCGERYELEISIELISQIARDPQRETCFPDTAWASEGDQRNIRASEQRDHMRAFPLSPDEWRARRRYPDFARRCVDGWHAAHGPDVPSL